MRFSSKSEYSLWRKPIWDFLSSSVNANCSRMSHRQRWSGTSTASNGYAQSRPSQDELKDAVLRMREKGLKATGCNSAIRAINTYVHWVNAGPDVKCGSACKHPKIAQLKEPQLVLPTFTEQQIRLLVAWKPKSQFQRRLHLLILFLLDTGCRISEALTLRVSEVDFENLLVTLDGKGRKQRVVPFSFELRKAMFRYCKESNRTPESTAFRQPHSYAIGAQKCAAGCETALPQAGIRPSRPHAPRLPSHFRGELS